MRRDAGGEDVMWGPLWASFVAVHPYFSMSYLARYLNVATKDAHKGPPFHPSSTRVPTRLCLMREPLTSLYSCARELRRGGLAPATYLVCLTRSMRAG